MLHALEWLKTDYQTLFRLNDEGQIERENDPDESPGPLFWLGGCEEGNVWGVRADVDKGISAQLAALTVDEPPFTSPNTPPRYLSRYVALLEEQAPVTRSSFGLIYELPHALDYDSEAQFIGSESEAGQEFMRALSRQGLPDALQEVGFLSPHDFWAPWCMALVDGKVASVACAARLSPVGAELGLTTIKEFRGHGFGAAATAGWTRLPALQSRTLFYSTTWDNHSSQRVTQRLGLRLRGASLRLS